MPEPLDLTVTTGESDEDSDVLEVAEPEQDYDEQDSGELPEIGDVEDTAPISDPDEVDSVARRSEKYTVDGYDVYVTSEQLFVVDVYQDRLRPVRYQQWVRDRVLALNREPSGLLEQWATARGRRELRELLRDVLCFDVDELAVRLRRPDCDPLDLLIHLGWEWPLHTRAERVATFNASERVYLDSYSPRARQVLATLLGKYAAHGVDELSASALRSPPLNELGSVVELAAAFGGPTQMHAAIDKLSQHLFDVSKL